MTHDIDESHARDLKKLRLVPVPGWVKDRLDLWTEAAKITEGTIFRAVRKNDKVSGASLSTTGVWKIVLHYAQQVGIERLAPHDLRSYAESRIMPSFSAVRAWVKEEPVNGSA